METLSYSNSLHTRLLIGAVIISTLIASLLGWLTIKSADDLLELQKKHEEIARLQGTVAHYDEILTMSARIGAATGDLRWEDRYHQFEPGLDQAIRRLVALQPKGVKAAEVTNIANTQLVEMETRSFQLIHANELRKATAILFSDLYEGQKKIYSKGMSDLYKDINLNLEKEWNSHSRNFDLLKITLFLFLTASALGWVTAFKKIRNWNRDLRQLNESLDAKVREQTSKLISSSKMSALGAMAGGIAHEINNPLAVIKVLSGQLRDVVDADSVDKRLLKEMTATVENTTDRIAKIILGLRSFSRDGSKDSWAPVDVFHLVDDTLSFCSERFKSLGTQLIVDEFAEGIKFEGRVTEVSQVLLNLLNNANDAIANQSEKWIRISILEQSDWLEIRVTDSGNGIPIELQTKIFEPFFTTKSIGKGTGMGLSISMGIVRSHGGELKLDKKCSNTCFVIRIPRKQGAGP